MCVCVCVCVQKLCLQWKCGIHKHKRTTHAFSNDARLTHTCTHACVHQRAHTRAHIHARAVVHKNAHAVMHAHTHTRTHARTESRRVTFTPTRAPHTRAHVHVRTHSRTHARTQAHTRTHTPACWLKRRRLSPGTCSRRWQSSAASRHTPPNTALLKNRRFYFLQWYLSRTNSSVHKVFIGIF